MGGGRETMRGGTRGGKDQFSWEEVRQDKHRENYLGSSLHAAQGRWQKGKDLTWYAKARKEDSLESLREERQRARQMEEDMIRARLGLAPQTRQLGGKATLDKHEVQKLLQRGGADPNGAEAASSEAQGDARFNAERGSGIGAVGAFGSARRAELAAVRAVSKLAPEDRLEGAAAQPATATTATWAPAPRRESAPDVAPEAVGAGTDSSDSEKQAGREGGEEGKQRSRKSHKHKRDKKEKKEKKEKKRKRDHESRGSKRPERMRHDSD
uniref:Multiple myeloma tumor-associated protein 2-like N-terminal domain-containing protein n=1 Tax=Chrysotila carterae TaxID=13221 RepID=A0A7S4BTU8_CHRCT